MTVHSAMASSTALSTSNSQMDFSMVATRTCSGFVDRMGLPQILVELKISRPWLLQFVIRMRISSTISLLCGTGHRGLHAGLPIADPHSARIGRIQLRDANRRAAMDRGWAVNEISPDR